MSYSTEKGLIGMILTDNEVLDVCGGLTPTMFTDDYLREIYQICLSKREKGEVADPLTLHNLISHERYPEDVQTSILTECIETAPIASLNAKDYVKIIKDEHKAEWLKNTLNVSITRENVDEVITSLGEQLQNAETGSGEKSESIAHIAKRLKGEHFNPNKPQGIPTGLGSLDGILGNLDPGDVCIMAARPSVGKSAIGNQIAVNMALAGHRVELFCLEMTKDQVYERLVAFTGSLDMSRVRRAINFLGDEEEKYNKANSVLEGLQDRLIIDDASTKVADFRREIKKNKIDVAVVDYAQLIKSDGTYRGNRYAEVGEISHQIKRLAKEQKIPIILLAQLNRVSADKENKEPTMSELRESGDFEQDASQIVLLWNKSEDRTVKGLKIDKNRQGIVGKIEMKFDGAHQEFYEETPFD